MRKMSDHLSKGRGWLWERRWGYLILCTGWILSAASPVLSCWVLLPYHSSTRENLQTPKKGALEAGADVED